MVGERLPEQVNGLPEPFTLSVSVNPEILASA